MNAQCNVFFFGVLAVQGLSRLICSLTVSSWVIAHWLITPRGPVSITLDGQIRQYVANSNSSSIIFQGLDCGLPANCGTGISRSCSRLIECSREKTVPTLLWHQTENAQLKMHKSEVDILSDCVVRRIKLDCEDSSIYRLHVKQHWSSFLRCLMLSEIRMIRLRM
jgi:hypothetical protein